MVFSHPDGSPHANPRSLSETGFAQLGQRSGGAVEAQTNIMSRVLYHLMLKDRRQRLRSICVGISSNLLHFPRQHTAFTVFAVAWSLLEIEIRPYSG